MKCLSIFDAALVTLAAVASLMLTTSAGSGSGTMVVGIDADPSGNTAITLGTIDRCIEVSSGDTFDLDVFVDAIPEDQDLAGFNYLLNYDPSKLQVNVCNNEMLIASEPGSYLWVEASCDPENLPDTDGELLVAAGDLGAGAEEPSSSDGPTFSLGRRSSAASRHQQASAARASRRCWHDRQVSTCRATSA